MSKQEKLKPITLEIAKEMTKEFRRSQGRGEGYTKAVWFPKDLFKKMSSALEANPDADGIRVYFGRYNAEAIKALNKGVDPKEQIPQSYIYRNTVIFISTKNVEGVAKTDYFEDSKFFEPENRGSLCPHDCPEPDSPMNQD